MRKLIWISICLTFPIISYGANADFKCSAEYQSQLKNYDVKSVNTSGGVKTTLYTLKSKLGSTYEVEVKEAGKSVTVTKTSNEKLSGWDASQMMVSTKEFEISDWGCSPEKFSEQTYAVYGGEKHKAVDINLDRMNCDVVKAELLKCSDKPNLPKAIWTSNTPGPALFRADLLSVQSRCVSQGLQNGGDVFFNNAIPSIIPEKYRREAGDKDAAVPKAIN